VTPETITEGRWPGYLLVRMNGSSADLAQILTTLPEAALQAVRARRAGLVFDHSGEGLAYRDKRSRRWHSAFDSMQVPPDQAIFLTQTLTYGEHYARWCAANGIDRSLKVLTYDYHIKKFFSSSWPSPRRALGHKRRVLEGERAIEKDFICLNFKPRPWRLALLTHLLRDGLWDDGLVSFGGLTQEEMPGREPSHIWRKGGPIEHFLTLEIAGETSDQLDALAARGQTLFGRSGDEANRPERVSDRVLDMDAELFARAAFSLVSETEMRAERQRITEKPFKALANFHPIVLFGNHHALRLVRDLGFRTFSPWIDEGYDEVSDPTERFRAAYAAFLAFKPKARRLVMEDPGLRAVLSFNLQHALTVVPEHFRRTIDPALCRAIRRSVPLAASRAPP